MQQYADVITDLKGNVVPGALVSILNLDGSLASLFATNGTTPISNPVTSDSTGYFVFRAANGNYKRRVTAAGVSFDIPGEIVLYASGNEAVAASEISNTPTGSVNGTTVQLAINELESEKVPFFLLNSPSGAAQIGVTPAGSLTGGNVQAALNELDAEKVPVTQLAAAVGAALVGFDQPGGTARSVQQQLDMLYFGVCNVRDPQFAGGAKGGGTINDTAAFQAAITAAAGKKVVFVPADPVGYLITDGLTGPKGTIIEGVNQYQGYWDYAAGAVGSKIIFNPATPKDFFTAVNLPLPVQDFLSRYAVSGLWITGTNANARHAFVLDKVIYSSFRHMQITGFDDGFLLTDTINNEFSHLIISDCRLRTHTYGASTVAATTDVWHHCAFRIAPVGVQLDKAIAIRYQACLFEGLDLYGADIAKDCQVIQFLGCYAEDVPFTNVGTSAMFRVGYRGTDSSLTTVLQVTGGSYAGRNAGLAGSFLDADDVKGVQLNSPQVSRFTNLIKTTASTADYAIACSGIQWLSCTNAWNDDTKLSGTIDFSAVNSGFGPIGFFAAVKAGTFSAKQYIDFPNGPAPAAGAAKTSSQQSDYSEGTWTPALKFGGASVGITGTQTGKYTKVGRKVTVQCLVILTAKGSSTGNASITGLPFAAVSAGPCGVGYQGMTGLSLTSHYADISASTALLRSTAATGFDSTTDANFTNTSVVNFIATYFV